MSFQATKFVLGLQGLTRAEKAVAWVLACHANQYGGNAYPSMERIAREAGFKDKRSAQRYVRRLEKKKIVIAMTAKTGGHGRDTATVYKLDFDYEPPMRDDNLATPPDGNPDEGGATNQTVRGDKPDGEGRQPGHPNRYEKGKKREWQEPTSSRVQKNPHTSLTNTMEEKEEEEIKLNQTSDSPPSTNNTVEKRAREVKPDQTSVPPPSKNNIIPNRPVQGSKKEFAVAPEVARLQAEILRIPLTNGRTFQCNGKLNAIIGEELRKGRSAALILQAAQYIGRTLPDRDQIPGLTLADNLAARIIAMEMEQAAAVEEKERQARAARDQKLEKRRYELIKAAHIEQEEEVGREYKSWKLKYPDASAEAFFPNEMHPSVFERYQLAEILRTQAEWNVKFVTEKRLNDLRREAGETPAILASVEAQLAAEGDREPEPFY
jgi:hypothetical protein